MLVFDSKEEILKIKQNFDDAECLIRLSTKSQKFGVDPDDVESIMSYANE